MKAGRASAAAMLLGSRRALSAAMEWIGAADASKGSSLWGSVRAQRMMAAPRGLAGALPGSSCIPSGRSTSMGFPATATKKQQRDGAASGRVRGMCSITNAADEWELAEAVEMVRDGTAKQQLKGIQMITAALKGVPVHPVGVPPLPTSEAEAFDSVRRIWARTFDDLAKEDGDAGGAPGAAPPDSEEGVISDLLSFGEVHIDAVSEILGAVRALGIMRQGVRPHPEEKSNLACWDLGAGSGKTALALALLHPFERVVGVEQDEDVHAESHERLMGMPDADKNSILSEVHLVGDRIADVTWTSGDFITVNSAKFSDSDMLDFAERTQELAPGAIVVSFSRRVASPFLGLIDHRVIPQAWGDMPVFIQQRQDDGDASDIASVAAARPFPLLPISSDSADQRMLREAGILPLLTDLTTTGQEASSRPHACMCLSFIANSEVSARDLVACGAIQSAVSLVKEGGQGGGGGELPPAWRASSVMTLRSLASHPVCVPHIVDDDDAVPCLVGLLSDESVAIAAGAADAITMCCTFLDAIPVVASHGAQRALKDLVRRAKDAGHEHAEEAAQFALDLIDAADKAMSKHQVAGAGPASHEGVASPVHAHLQKLGVGHK